MLHPFLKKIGKIPNRVQLIGFCTSTSNCEPLMRKDEGYEVFSRPYDSKVGSELPCMLSKLMVACGGKYKRGTRSNGQMATKEWARRHRKRQGGITECRRAVGMPGRIHERCGPEKVSVSAHKQRPIVGKSYIHQWLKKRIALVSVSHFQRHPNPLNPSLPSTRSSVASCLPLARRARLRAPTCKCHGTFSRRSE